MFSVGSPVNGAGRYFENCLSTGSVLLKSVPWSQLERVLISLCKVLRFSSTVANDLSASDGVGVSMTLLGSESTGPRAFVHMYYRCLAWLTGSPEVLLKYLVLCSNDFLPGFSTICYAIGG